MTDKELENAKDFLGYIEKYNISKFIDSTNAGYSFKYFGTDKGVVDYKFIDESHFNCLRSLISELAVCPFNIKLPLD